METFAYVVVALVGLPSLFHLLRRLGARREPTPPQEFVNDVYEAAFLTAGPGRVADTVLAVLATEERIEIRDPGLVALRDFEPRDPVEAAFLDAFRATPTSALHWLRIAVMRSAAVQTIGDSLAARGLAVRPGDPRPRSRRGLPLAVTGLVLCAWALFVPIMAIPLAIYGFVALLLNIGKPLRKITTEGRIALVSYRRAHESATDTAHLVALHGRARIADRDLYLRLTNASGPGSRHQYSSTTPDPGLLFAATVTWCGGGTDHSSCGGSSCGSSPDSGWSSGGSSGGGGCSSGSSSCGGGSSSSCGSSSGGSSCGGGGGSSCGSSS